MTKKTKNASEKNPPFILIKTTIISMLDKKAWIFFLLILVVGLYLRFYRIEDTLAFGWDQARDAWTVRDIIQGKLTLIGPKTGVGSFHLGPMYYYFLVPFFAIFHLDPMAANYFNILANICNFLILFFVSRKLFSGYGALFVTLIYATSSYWMASRVPWNVTLMPGIAALIFYAITRVYKGEYRYIFLVWLLAGFFFNIHFTAVFLPFIIIPSLFFVKNKKRVIQLSLLSIPLFVIWYVPSILHELLNRGSESTKYIEFFQAYAVKPQLEIVARRIPEVFVQFGALVEYPYISFLKYSIPIIFVMLGIVRANQKDRLFVYLISLWFIIPFFGFLLYGGPVSDYYLLFTAPMVLWIVWFLQEKLYMSRYRVLIGLLVILWGIFIFINTKDHWIKSEYGGLRQQKDEARAHVEVSRQIQFNEGDIKAYLYVIGKDDGQKF